jgi:UDP-N-acetylmuramate--alanine ligase
MKQKTRVGIIFGGQSREREISFAGGRTVYDNLNKSLFDVIPVFVDSFNNFIELEWEFIYKGSIRDFYPPVDALPVASRFQLYAENLGPVSAERQNALASAIGKPLTGEALAAKIDFAFLCLHGPYGEDGRIQGLFEFLGIPYSGSGVLASAIGIDKSVQKALMREKGFNCPNYLLVDRNEWIGGKCKDVYGRVRTEIGLPCVVKPASQGSSIGVSILDRDDEEAFMAAVEKAMFTRWVDNAHWKAMNTDQKLAYMKSLSDIREGISLPVAITQPEQLGAPVIYDPEQLLKFIDENPGEEGFVLESVDAEATVMVESFIKGREFSCIVIEDEDGTGIALPPTEIRKGAEIYDYRSKYLPGLSRKITPIDLPDDRIRDIRSECERLFRELRFDVYARIDGFIGEDGKIFLNDPNTTSGMMPSSFFFHQAAEIGLNPSQFLTFIIRSSLAKRVRQMNGVPRVKELLTGLDAAILEDRNALGSKTKVAVILGGYSSERHISVESGRNVYEKLASSEKYLPFPVFLTGDAEHHRLYRIPVNLLLKDNADDIREKIEHFKLHPLVEGIREKCGHITSKYASRSQSAEPELMTYEGLAKEAGEVFIALHGRPGEDGAVQEKLDALGVPYNGSGKESSSLTIDKYRTNELLRENGFLVAKHMLVTQGDWHDKKAVIREKLAKEIGFPFIAKPVDDGCSSAVKKIKSFEEFDVFARLLFRETGSEPAAADLNALHIKPKEEIPCKQVILVEELIGRKDADHFLEITGGMLTRFNGKGGLEYEVFEASEALSEGEVLSLEEKFLAGQGQNITPARYAKDPAERQKISDSVKATLGRAARVLGVTGYCRIDAFVRVYRNKTPEVIFIEVNSLPGMTPATCIFHQAAISHYKPYEFIDRILEFGKQRTGAA